VVSHQGKPSKEPDMGHYLSEMNFAHDREKERLWERRDAMASRLSDMPLSDFTFAQLADLILVADSNAVSNRRHSLEEALDRLEKFFAERTRVKPLKSPAKPPRRRR
jgi:hypothetical protein